MALGPAAAGTEVGPRRGPHGYHCAGSDAARSTQVFVPSPRILGAFQAGGAVATAGPRSDHARRGGRSPL